MSKQHQANSPPAVELDDALDQMSRDFYDPMLNRYDSGPGADLDDRQQPGALAAANSNLGGEGSGMASSDPPAVRIRLKNTRDLSEDGLRQLCRPYGTVVSVHKPKKDNCNYAFVEFVNQSEAGCAIQELNRKLGFQFYPAFAHEKKEIHLPEEVHIQAPPPPFEPGPGERLVQTLEINPNEEYWEATLAKRKIKSGFSIPLKIKFPARESLSTAPHYVLKLGKLSPLSRVDADQIFSIVTLVESKHRGSKTAVDSNIKDRLEGLVQRAAAKRLTVVGQRNGRPVYGYSGLSEEHSHLFPDTCCVACGQLGFFSCSICGAPYCSKHCQEADYQAHRDFCHLKGWNDRTASPNKGKKGLFEDLDDASLSQEMFPKGAHVIILSVLSPDRVYVRALEKESNKEYLQTLSDVAQAGIDAEILNSTPEPGDICLALYEPLNIYGRVLVTKVTRKQAHCVFIEYGLVVLVNFEHLKQLNNNDLKLRKVRIHKVHLKGITDEYGNIEKAMVYLNSLIGIPLEMKVQLEGRNMVDAQLRTAEGIIVNQQINQLIIIPIIKVIEDTESFIDYKNVPHKKLTSNQELDIMILNRTTIKLDFRVTLIAFEDLPYLEDLQRKLQCYGKKVEQFTEHYTPRLNEVCLVRNMDTWYRAVLLESVGDGRPSVYLCDYGCLLMAQLENIRKIPHSLVTEVRTTDAKIFGLEEAKKAGVKIDSEFLDIYLEENERLKVQTSEETEFAEFGEALSEEETSMLSVIKVPDFVDFIVDRAL